MSCSWWSKLQNTDKDWNNKRLGYMEPGEPKFFYYLPGELFKFHPMKIFFV